MESTLITFINNSSNIFRITILYLFQISIHFQSRYFKIFNNKMYMFIENMCTSLKIDIKYLSTTLRSTNTRLGVNTIEI
jgi:hypothetical protein